jgi:hypothetical protein
MSDDRLKKAQGEDKASRAMHDRAVTENRQLTEDDRVDEFLGSVHQTHLPNLPKIPGWHVCWLTTTNNRDTVEMRRRAGYELVTPEDVPGWSFATLKSGEYAGYIGVNEMVAAKIPFRLYERIMKRWHHEDPMSEEGRLHSVLDVIRDDAAKRGIRTYAGDEVER